MPPRPGSGRLDQTTRVGCAAMSPRGVPGSSSCPDVVTDAAASGADRRPASPPTQRSCARSSTARRRDDFGETGFLAAANRAAADMQASRRRARLPASESRVSSPSRRGPIRPWQTSRTARVTRPGRSRISEGRRARSEQRAGQSAVAAAERSVIMKRVLLTMSLVACAAGVAFAQKPAPSGKKAPLVEFEMMTWPEVKAALAAGKTTALVYTGGTEQRGPQNVNGGHTLMGREIAKAIALEVRKRDRSARAALHAEQRQRAAAGDDRADAGAARRAPRAHYRAGDDHRLQERRRDGRSRRRTASHLRRSREEDGREATRRKASTSTSATRSTPRRRATSTSGCRSTATRSARTPAFPTRRRCCISAATRAGCGRS